jgi:hypothetical protein
MQKIILNKENKGLIIDRLQKLMSGIYREENSNDWKPKRQNMGSWKKDPDPLIMTQVRTHWLQNDSSGRGSLNPPLIQMCNNTYNGGVAHEGDIFYFIGTRSVIIHRKDSYHLTDQFEKITCLKKKKDMSMEEIIDSIIWKKKLEVEAREDVAKAEEELEKILYPKEEGFHLSEMDERGFYPI